MCVERAVQRCGALLNLHSSTWWGFCSLASGLEKQSHVETQAVLKRGHARECFKVLYESTTVFSDFQRRTAKYSHLVRTHVFFVCISYHLSFITFLLYDWKKYMLIPQKACKSKKVTNFTFAEQVSLLVLAVEHCVVVFAAGKMVVTSALGCLAVTTRIQGLLGRWSELGKWKRMA